MRPGEIADAVTALRLATCGPIAAGPVLFERLDWRPFGVRPVLPIAATQPPGEPTRLDVFRGETARVLIGKLGAAEDDRELGDALDRWELALFQDGSFRAEQLRSSLEALLGDGDGAWAAALRSCRPPRRDRAGAAGLPRSCCAACARASRAPRRRISSAARSSRRVTRGRAARSSSPSSTSRCSECARRPSSRVAQALAS